jgi:hypothetical protein
MKSPVPGQSLIAIDAGDWTRAALAFGDKWDLWAALEVERVIHQSAEIVQRAVRKRAKRHYRTGRLEKNVRIAETGAGWDFIARVRSGGSVAHLVAANVRPHMIVSDGPKSPAMPLYRGNSITGFAQAVQHPGHRGDPYFHVGAMNSRLAINAVLKASAKKMVAHLAEITAIEGRHL